MSRDRGREAEITDAIERHEVAATDFSASIISTSLAGSGPFAFPWYPGWSENDTIQGKLIDLRYTWECVSHY
jgi:hypothetical protein